MTADQIRFVRDVFGLSQRDLSKAMNVSPATVARWETANERGSHAPTGLQYEVLHGLHSVALKVKDDETEKQMIAGLIVLGIGALIFYLLTQK